MKLAVIDIRLRDNYVAREYNIRSDVDSRYLLHRKNSLDQLQAERSSSTVSHEKFGMYIGTV